MCFSLLTDPCQSSQGAATGRQDSAIMRGHAPTAAICVVLKQVRPARCSMLQGAKNPTQLLRCYSRVQIRCCFRRYGHSGGFPGRTAQLACSRAPTNTRPQLYEDHASLGCAQGVKLVIARNDNIQTEQRRHTSPSSILLHLARIGRHAPSPPQVCRSNGGACQHVRSGL